MDRDALVEAMARAAGGTAWPAMTEEFHNLLRDGARKSLDVAEPVLRHWFALDARVVSERPSDAHDRTDARCEPPPALRGNDGWHWLSCNGRERCAYWWEPLAGEWRWWNASDADEWRYVEPCLTPAEVAALRAERDAAVAEVVGLKGTVASVDEDNDALRATIREMSTSLTTLRAEVERLTKIVTLAKQVVAMPPQTLARAAGVAELRAALKTSAP